jgi:acetyl esterase/lipase
MAETLEAARAVRVEDIVYRRRQPNGGEPLLARLYRPAPGTGPFPCIVDVHGGAWTGSDRFNNEGIATEFARAGIVTLSLDFRMPPEAAYPASLQDINYGVRWMKAHAAEFGVRAEKVGLFGTSSGGHQVLLAALRPKDPRYAALRLEEAPDVDASVAFVISGWGVLDPLLRYRLAKERRNEKMIASHDAFWRSEAAMEEGCPAAILERGEAVATPPALVFQGDADEWVPNAAAERLAAAWRAARGGRCELALFPGEGHTFLREKPEAPNSVKALAMVTAFIRAEGGTT